MHYDGWYGGWGMGGMWLVWAIPIGAVILFAVWVTGASRRSVTEESALDILKKRFARGEISPEEYEERMRKLRSDG